MNISSCLTPAVFRNKFTGELMSAPCGKCDACVNLNNDSWAFRLRQEQSCWPYTVFFTLTYDEDHCPRFVPYYYHTELVAFVHSLDGEYIPVSSVREALLSRLGSMNKVLAIMDSLFLYLTKYDSIRVPYVPHIQKFIKLVRYYISKINGYEKDPDSYKIRYFVSSEYGETTQRPHYHGLLFFKSERLAKEIFKIISDCWKYGFSDIQFATGGAASYCSSYLNCSSSLPEFLKIAPFKCFRLFSRRPPIGSLLANDVYVKKLFESGSTTEVIYDDANKRVISVPIRPYLKNRLYPRCAKFTDFDAASLFSLYEFSNKCLSSKDEDLVSFLRYHEQNQTYYYGLLKFYLDLDFAPDKDLAVIGVREINCLRRLYLISKRVITQARIFGITRWEYVKRIQTFYSRWALDALARQYKFQSEYVRNGPSQELIAMYPLALSEELPEYLRNVHKESFSIQCDEDCSKYDLKNNASFSVFKFKHEWRKFNNAKTHHIKEYYRKVNNCVF